jgi:hypothetical protein
MSTKLLGAELITSGRKVISPTSIFTRISSVFNEAEESIQQLLLHSETLLAEFQQKSVHIVQQYETDLSNIDEHQISNWDTGETESSREMHELPPMEDMSTAASSSNSEVKEDKQEDSSWATEISSSNSSSFTKAFNLEQRHCAREKILSNLTELKDMEVKLQEKLLSYNSENLKSGNHETTGEQYQELQQALEQCQQQHCEAISEMVNEYRPYKNFKSRLHESKTERTLKSLGFKFPTIDSILKSADSQDKLTGISHIQNSFCRP